MKTFIKWLLVSSANPENVSLTVKGILVWILPYIVNFAPLVHLTLSSSGLSQLFDGVGIFIKSALTIIGVSLTIYGAVRKIILTHAI